MKYKVTKIFKKSKNRLEMSNSYNTFEEAAYAIDDWISLSNQNFEIKEDKLDVHKEWHSESYVICLDETGFVKEEEE